MIIAYRPNQYSQQRQREKPAWVYPVRLAMEATFYRNHGHQILWDKEGKHDVLITKPQNLPFGSLPYPDRELTNAFDKRYQMYGNYKYHPATHIQVADGCWHGRCSFCVEQGRNYYLRKIPHVLAELDDLRRLGFKEAFDDSGTFPTGAWLDQFCHDVIKMNPGIVLGCNMRIVDVDWALMKRAGFRMVLFGIESANQKTLDRIQKGVKSDDIIPTIKRASEAGLDPHVCVIMGQPGETKKEEFNTLELVSFLLRKGYAKTAQASVYEVNGVRGVPHHSTRAIYMAARHPGFWYHKLNSIRTRADLAYLWKSIKKGIRND